MKVGRLSDLSWLELRAKFFDSGPFDIDRLFFQLYFKKPCVLLVYEKSLDKNEVIWLEK